MSLAYIEYRAASGDVAIIHDISLHLWPRLAFGKSLIITSDPDGACYAMQKHWQRLCRRLAETRSNADAPAQMIALSKQIARMQQTQITAQLPSDRPQADIFLLSPDKLNDLLPIFATLYVTCEAPRNILSAVVETMPARSLVVIY